MTLRKLNFRFEARDDARYNRSGNLDCVDVTHLMLVSPEDATTLMLAQLQADADARPVFSDSPCGYIIHPEQRCGFRPTNTTIAQRKGRSLGNNKKAAQFGQSNSNVVS